MIPMFASIAGPLSFESLSKGAGEGLDWQHQKSIYVYNIKKKKHIYIYITLRLYYWLIVNLCSLSIKAEISTKTLI